jgi:hypothetical protein
MLYLKNFKVFYKDRLNFWLLNLTALLLVASWVLFLFKPIVHSPLAILHYNVYFGFDVVGNWIWLILVPSIVLLASLINLLLAVCLWTKESVLSYFLLTLNFLLNFMVFIYLFNILNYNL